MSPEMPTRRLSDVNTRDIRSAIALGCRAMERLFDADDNDTPLFESQVRPACFLGFNPATSDAHVPGRWLNALLRAQAVAGVAVDERTVQKLRRVALFSVSGPVALPLNRDSKDGPLRNFFPGNLREITHAFAALAQYRQDEQAAEAGQRVIQTVLQHWDPQRRWNDAWFTSHGLRLFPEYFMSDARCIGPMVKFYRATGFAPALELAMLFKEKSLAEHFTTEGRYDPSTFGTHVHTITCVVSSLAQLADFTGDAALLSRVRTFYDCGLHDLRDELGWSPENTAPGRDGDYGESNNTGDILEAALVLGRHGHADAFADAERILRAHLLPSQLRDVSWIVQPPNPGGLDALKNIADRHLGCFGFPTSYGYLPPGSQWVSFNTDIVGGAVASLCEALVQCTRRDAAGHWVNMLFDVDNDDLRVESPYTHPALSITLKRPGPLFVRIPPWAAPDSVRVTGCPCAPRWTNGYILLAAAPAGSRITIHFNLAVQDIVLHHRARDIRVRLRGDEVVGMDDFGAELTFFPPLEA